MKRKQVAGWRWLVGVIAALLTLDISTFLLAEGFWFQEVGYIEVFSLRILTQAGLRLFVSGVSLWFLWNNLAIASRHTQLDQQSETTDIPPQNNASSQPGYLRFRWLLLLTIAISITIGLLLLYHGQIAANHWHFEFSSNTDPQPIPTRLRIETLWQTGQQLATQPWLLGGVGVVAIALLIYPRLLSGAIALLVSLSFGLVLSEHWATVLAALYATPFDRVDPLFQQDLSVFIFLLPVLQLLTFWLIGLFTLALLTSGLVYLLSGNSLSRGYFPGFAPTQQQHLYRLGGCLMLAVSLCHWLDRYELLYSNTGVAYGASYTNVVAELPANTILAGLALLIAIYLFLQTGILKKNSLRDWVLNAKHHKGNLHVRQSTSSLPSNRTRRAAQSSSSQLHRSTPAGVYLIALYAGLVAIAAVPLPLAVQRLIVQPTELELEQPYIERSIAFTREAFNLETVDVETFNPQYTLNTAALERNSLTVDNIRLWDTRPLLETNRQLQRIRPYYEFPDADVDRYALPTEDGETAIRQVFIAARELDYDSVPAEAQTWVNKHLIYTHGYGFTLSPVNTAGEGGLPDYFVQGIEQTVSDARIREAIPISNPRIYYGEITNTYVMTQTGVRELDYPSGSDNVYNTYDGLGGVNIGAFWRRLLYAKHLRDWRMMLTENLTPQSRVLFRRQIASRARAIAPFLRYDTNPYLVVANTQPSTPDPQAPTSNYLYWIIDAYTTSDRYPYSDPGGNNFNYIRNSVKVVVDAYNGSISFYVSDEQDPIIRTWRRAFPGMFQPLNAMPVELRNHVRYPQDFYQVQSNQLMVYHMTDPQLFYNREDQWRAPNEIYGDEPRRVEPYYLIMKLPEGNREEFILFRPYAPSQRTNLIAWLAARSDGDNYGKMLLYNFPKQELIYGTEQLEARINQDPVISQQISLWNRRGSRAVQGNLLVIPLERSLLYVEPLYLEAEQNRLPILARVIVAYANRIAMAETLRQALNAIFQPTITDPPAIIRPLEEEGVPPV